MRLSRKSWFGALTLAVGLVGSAGAEEPSSLFGEPFDLGAEQAATTPPITLVSSAQQSSGDADGDRSYVGRDFVLYKNQYRGLSAGMEMIMLRPYFSEDFLTTAAHLDFEPSYRYWGMYQSADGLGGRLRYWSIDQFEVFGASQVGVEFRTMDAEMVQNIDFRRWNFLMSGGCRYGEASSDINRFESGFDGIGLTVAMQGTRDLNSSGSLRMTMGGRWSALYGNSKDFTNGIQTNIDRDDLVSIMELNIGPQYTRPFGNGTLTMGGGLEAQHWSNGATDDTQDFGFAGFMSSISFSR
jgi:hypothetical protein